MGSQSGNFVLTLLDKKNSDIEANDTAANGLAPAFASAVGTEHERLSKSLEATTLRKKDTLP